MIVPVLQSITVTFCNESFLFCTCHYIMSHHTGVTSLVGYLGGNTAPHLTSTYITTNTTIAKVPANINCNFGNKINVGY